MHRTHGNRADVRPLHNLTLTLCFRTRIPCKYLCDFNINRKQAEQKKNGQRQRVDAHRRRRRVRTDKNANVQRAAAGAN